MTRIFLLAALGAVLLSLPVAAQDSLQFNEFHDTVTILEGEPVIWFISLHDPLFPDTYDSIYLVPPSSDPMYQSSTIFEKFDDTTWNFQFNPFYDFIDSGETTLAMTFYGANQTDTVSMPVTITVVQFNPPPELAPIPGSFRIVEGVLFTLEVTATDPDLNIPTLETSALPANATFADSLNGHGALFFTPDETQYGDSALDYTIVFYARDEESSDGQTVTITVVGPNLPPVFDAVDPQTVVEGDTLSFTVTAVDPNGAILDLTTSPLPDSSSFIDNGDGTGAFEFWPTFTQAGSYEVEFYAFDGLYGDTLIVPITVEDAPNQPPVFGPLPDTSIAEGSGTLNILVTASDPEGNRVTLFWLDSIPNSSFDVDSYAQDTGMFSFTPGMDQGGSYQIRFKATDNDTLNPEIDSVTLYIEVTEVDQPPNLFIKPLGAQAVYEGGRLLIEYTAYDDFENELQVNIFPPPDSAVFKGAMSKVITADSGHFVSGYLEFTPDFGFIQGKTDTVIVLKFSTADEWDTIYQERVLTIYDVKQDVNDPLDADTLTLVGAVWDDSLPGFKMTTRIWNDSAIAAGMTGFRWYDSWLQCDTIIFSPRLEAAQYKRTYIYNDSLKFLVSFIFFDSMYVEPGEGDYFTAYFKYNPDSVDVDTITNVRYDTAKVGSSGDFFFDKRVRAKSFKEATANDLALSADAIYTYKPLVKFGSIRSAINRVRMSVYNTDAGIALGNGSKLYVRNTANEPIEYQIRFMIENKDQLADLSLDFLMSSLNDEVSWNYHDPVVSVVPYSRMFPDTAVWPVSSGLQLTAFSLDGQDSDSFHISGQAAADNGGLPAGLNEYMVSIPFTLEDVTGEEAMICFDSASVNSPAAMIFTDTSGQVFYPAFEGSLCLPVAYNPLMTTDRASLEIYDVGNNVTLDSGSVLYARSATGQVKHYEIRLKVANTRQLADLGLDFVISAINGGVAWAYSDTVFIADTTSRMYPDSTFWSIADRLQIDSAGFDGMGTDSFRVAWTAEYDSTGLPPGPYAAMVRIPFTITSVTGSEAVLCFDTGAFTPSGDWFYSDTAGQVVAPLFTPLCLPVAYSPQIVTDRVALEVYDVGADLVLTADSMLYMRDITDNPKEYQLRLQIENIQELGELSLDFRIFAANQDVTWTYQDPIFMVDTLSRMYPDSSIWTNSSGLQFTGVSLDGQATDSFRVFGVGDPPDSGGLTAGALQSMVTIPFAIQDVIGDQAVLCFDTGAAGSPGTWFFADTAGFQYPPYFDGALCFGVHYSPVTDVNHELSPTPGIYSLSQNYPNPFNPTTTIRFSVPRRGHVSITVFNILGQVVTTLTDRTYDVGTHEVVWDGRDGRGQTTASGIYLYRMESEGLTATRKMVLLR